MARQDEERAKRLAEALRENLRRRKAQARGEDPSSLEERGAGRSPVEGLGEDSDSG